MQVGANMTGNGSSGAGPGLLLEPGVLSVLSVAQVVLGLLAFLFNGGVLLLLGQKKKKMASEYIVLANVLIDGLYGLCVLILGSLNVVIFYFHHRFTHGQVLNCIATYTFHSLLTFASLMLVLLIQVNRVVAVRSPILYKLVFTVGRVRLLLGLVFAASAGFGAAETAICVLDPNQKSTFSYSYGRFYLWTKLALVAVETVGMLVVYKLIAHQFTRSFWTPIIAPFLVCCPRRRGPRAAQCPAATDRGANASPGEPTRRTSIGSYGSGDEETEGRSRAATTTSTVNGRARAPSRAQQQKHYVTTVFFFVSVLYLMLSYPVCVSQFISILHPTLLSPELVVYTWSITETLYVVNFVLNPYLYSFNNSYLKERIARLRRPARPEQSRPGISLRPLGLQPDTAAPAPAAC